MPDFRIENGRYWVSSEALGYWFLRLNGFLTTPNFVVHPDTDSQQGTDVDVLGVRFPYRRENRQRPMIDADRFRRHRDKAYVALAEIKTGVCRLNGPWTAPERENMQRVLSALGMLAPHEVGLAGDDQRAIKWTKSAATALDGFVRQFAGELTQRTGQLFGFVISEDNERIFVHPNLLAESAF